ncbi:MAG: ABC transporter permease [candidate division WOR-3 bacterium]
MNFFTLAFKNLLRRKIRTVLTIQGIAIAIFVLFSLLSFQNGYKNSLTRELDDLGINILAVPKGCPYEAASLIVHGGVIPKYLDETDVEQVRQIDGIELATPIFLGQIYEPEQERTSIIYGILPEEYTKIKPGWKIQGQYFITTDTNAIVIGNEVAYQEKLNVGDEVYFPSISKVYKVTGILQRTGGQDDGFYFLPLAEAQRIFNKSGKITAVAIKIKDLSQISELSEKLEQISDIQVVTMAQVLGTILNLIGSARTLIFSVVVIALIIGTLGIVNTMFVTIYERRREIGIIKAIGADNIDVVKLIVLETLIIAIIGGIEGSLLSIFGGRLIENFVRGAIPYAPKRMLFTFQFANFGIAIAYSIIIGVLAAIFPSIKAASLSPLETIRKEN